MQFTISARQIIKQSVCKTGFISVFALASLAFVESAQAASIDFTSGNFGNTSGDANGNISLSTNAGTNEDITADSNFSFSGTAVESPTLENSLGIPPNIAVTEGSGNRQSFTFTQPTTLSFDWIFQTNESAPFNSAKPENDFAFISIFDGTNRNTTTLADAVAATTLSSSNFANEISGTFTQTLQPGTYDIALGVVDLEDFNRTSALVISNAQAEPVPEPLTILGSVVAIAFGAKLKKKFSKEA